MSLKIIKIRKSHERFRTTREWLNSMHSFSFAEHRDPKWDNFGKIRVINEDIISPNAGFNTALGEIISSFITLIFPKLSHSGSLCSAKENECIEFSHSLVDLNLS